MWFVTSPQSSNLEPLTNKEDIWFPFILAKAMPWKNLVSLSPSWSHLYYNLWFHCNRKILSTEFFFANSLAKSCWDSSLESRLGTANNSFALMISTTAKWFMLHTFKLHFSFFSPEENLKPAQSVTKKLPHHFFISPKRCLFSSHISTNMKVKGPI